MGNVLRHSLGNAWVRLNSLTPLGLLFRQSLFENGDGFAMADKEVLFHLQGENGTAPVVFDGLTDVKQGLIVVSCFIQ
jgi:hypothetical protein